MDAIRWALCVVVLEAAFVALALVTATAEPTDGEQTGTLGPEETVRSVLTRAMVIVDGEGTKNSKLSKLYVLAGEFISSDTMGRNALGETLASQTPEKEKEFLDLFGSLVVRAYLQKLLFFRNPNFEYEGFGLNGESATVTTQILTRKDTFRVEYPMHRSEEGWVATDIVVEDASLTQNYQRQFESLLRHQSFDALLDKLRRKVEHLRGAGE